ncbi:MAG: hypothetical protein ACOYMF_08300 [Bacteroidales bacterium]
MYEVILSLHFLNRRLILIAGFIVIAFAFHGWKTKKVFSLPDNILGIIFISVLHLQLILGLLLYFVYSPKTAYALAHLAEAMHNSKLRYFAVEHWFIMILAVGIAQAGRIQVNKTKDSTLKNRRSFIYFSIALLLILLMVPFGNSQQGMSLFRF